MGKRGPKPKPTALRVFEGTRIQRPTDRSQEPIPGAGDIPQAPDWLGSYGKAEWLRIAPLLHAVGCLTEVDQSQLSLYCHHWDDFHRARQNVATNGLVVMTEKGEISNPAIRTQYMAAGLIVKLGDRYGMTPAARVGLSGAQQDHGHDDLDNFKRSDTA